MPGDKRAVGDTPRRALLKAMGAGALSLPIAGCSSIIDDGDSTAAPSATETATDDGTASETDSTGGDGDDPDGDSGSGTVGDTAGLEPCLRSESSDDEPMEVGGAITSDTTFGAETSEYTVTNSLSVQDGATLTIEPGTRLRFAQDAGLSVQQDSALSAVGNCGAPIVFTGEQQSRGYWKGIHVDEADQTRSELVYSVVEYAGGSDFGWASAAANVAVSRGGRLRIDNSSIRESAAYGVAFGGNSTVDSFEQNVVTANADGAGHVAATSAQFLSDTSTYTGNDVDEVRLVGNTLGTKYEETWDAIDVPYTVQSGSTVEIGGHLTIDPGATLEFGQRAGMQVTGAGPGELTAVGIDPDTEASKPITFTGGQQTRGYWKGISFDESDRVPSKLQNVVVEYGGGEQYGWANAAANVATARGSRVAISNSTIRESGAYGFTFDETSTVDAFVANTVSANEEAAGHVTANVAHFLSDTSTYTGNDHDHVFVVGKKIGEDLEITWDAIDVPYRVQTTTDVAVNGHLIIDPGSTVEFGQDAALRTLGSGPGRITAVGIDPETEESKPITFTGEQQTRGYWRGIKFDESNRTENQLNNVVVEYAGGEEFAWAPERGSIVATRGSRVRIDGSTIRESDSYGVVVSANSQLDSFTRNTVTRNADGPAHLASNRAHELSDTGTYTGNDDDRVVLQGNTITRDVTWDALDSPYMVKANTHVEIQGHLTVDPGTTVEFGQDAKMAAVGEGDGPGALTAKGSADVPITFTGEQKTAGYWYGLAFDETARAENGLEFVTVEYGGADAYSWADDPANVSVIRGSSLTMENCTLSNGNGYAVIAEDGSVLSETANDFGGNALGTQP
ncbi:right-handed parallel beta-helix repeat-containing protein [Haloarchaeobius sp. DFWS5]|uniref:right-handed parallel beta-helix repeat-containing protein n=1 Tax=Haloarchaeobius sp. DFWS5 TaxID=3446114 RepID=UPI003EBEAEA9